MQGVKKCIEVKKKKPCNNKILWRSVSFASSQVKLFHWSLCLQQNVFFLRLQQRWKLVLASPYTFNLVLWRVETVKAHLNCNSALSRDHRRRGGGKNGNLERTTSIKAAVWLIVTAGVSGLVGGGRSHAGPAFNSLLSQCTDGNREVVLISCEASKRLSINRVPTGRREQHQEVGSAKK